MSHIGCGLFALFSFIHLNLRNFRSVINNSNLVEADNILTVDQIEEFKRNGVLVIKNVLSTEEIIKARQGLHNYLLSIGCDINKLESTASSLKNLSSVGGAGGVLDVFYEDWKLSLNEHPRVVKIFNEIWKATYADPNNKNLFPCHPLDQDDEIIDGLNFDPQKSYFYIDRICVRVPDSISDLYKDDKRRPLQRSLTPHLDCCPHDIFGLKGLQYLDHSFRPIPSPSPSSSPFCTSTSQHPSHHPSQKKIRKWRPVQGFVPLTDTFEAEEGGFEACPGHHLRFDEWVRNRLRSPTPMKNTRYQQQQQQQQQQNQTKKKKRENKDQNEEKKFTSTTPSTPTPSPSPSPSTSSSSPDPLSLQYPPCVGDFSPIRPIEDSSVIRGMRPVPCGAGDVVVWDYRIPHANSRHNRSQQTREAIYLGLLPATKLNERYAAHQLQRLREGRVPGDQWHEHQHGQTCTYEFSVLGRKMMTIDPW